MPSYAIDIQNLTKYYDKTKGVENLTLNVEEGEIFGFIGPNGAGKSTTIRVLLDLIRPTSGKASLFGSDCRVTNSFPKHMKQL
jgi:ABC-2 type transport system ATP-binding protein